MGSGKTCAAEYLRDAFGIQYVRYSQVLKDLMSSPEAGKVELQSFGWEIMESGRQSELNVRLLSRLDRNESAVIDGLRHPVDFECLSNGLGPSFRLVFLQAEPATRFERTSTRFSSRAEFEKADLQPVESHIESLRSDSSAVIVNSASLEYLYAQLYRLVGEFGKGEKA
jgi:dephospho-CoA kinase